ncbi:hypothetical protein [Streptomyces sp. NPDC090445]|uniref:hypothetical protein n=1 Tax=Streptomyces sp. NPDC090445 TaxID=3365963 RepID=UPI0037F5934D
MREQGFSDLAEGTARALLVRMGKRGPVDVEKAASEKGPPRKVHSAPSGSWGVHYATGGGSCA